jgi:hypothetical protein
MRGFTVHLHQINEEFDLEMMMKNPFHVIGLFTFKQCINRHT